MDTKENLEKKLAKLKNHKIQLDKLRTDAAFDFLINDIRTVLDSKNKDERDSKAKFYTDIQETRTIMFDKIDKNLSAGILTIEEKLKGI